MKISVAEVIEKIQGIDYLCEQLNREDPGLDNGHLFKDITEVLEEYKSFILRLGVNW